MPGLVEIGKRTFFDTFAGVNDPQDMAQYLDESFDPDMIQSELNDPGITYFLAESENQLVGYLKLKEGAEEPCVTGDRPVELVRLYLDASCIGKGFGTAMMKHALQDAASRGYKILWLGVWEDNERAIAFYKKWGFKTVGKHTFMLGSDAQTDLIMQRETVL